jgi:hypothetical protein
MNINNRITSEKIKAIKIEEKEKIFSKDILKVQRYDQLCYWRDHGKGTQEGLRFKLIKLFTSLTSRGMSIRMSLRYMSDYLGATPELHINSFI